MPIHLPPISRRRFLASSLAAAAGTVVCRWVRAELPVDADRWALMADTHIPGQTTTLYKGIKPGEHLAQVVKEIVALNPRPGGVIHCGDCAYKDGQPGDYGALAALLAPLRAAGIPIHIALGNHDHREHFWAAFPEARRQSALAPQKHAASVSTSRADWVILDSLEKSGATPGRFGKAQLQWLVKTLKSRPDRPALVVGHHNLDPKNALLDTEDFLKAIAAHPRAKAYFYGHTHAWGVSQRGGLRPVNVPSTAAAHDAKQPCGWVELTLRAGGATAVLHALDAKHTADGNRVDLAWPVA